jgi:hypothetical protein
MKIIGCDFHTRYQQIAMMGGWRTLPGGFAFPGGRSFAIFEGAEGLVCFLSDDWRKGSSFYVMVLRDS